MPTTLTQYYPDRTKMQGESYNGLQKKRNCSGLITIMILQGNIFRFDNHNIKETHYSQNCIWSFLYLSSLPSSDFLFVAAMAGKFLCCGNDGIKSGSHAETCLQIVDRFIFILSSNIRQGF